MANKMKLRMMVHCIGIQYGWQAAYEGENNTAPLSLRFVVKMKTTKLILTTIYGFIKFSRLLSPLSHSAAQFGAVWLVRQRDRQWVDLGRLLIFDNLWCEGAKSKVLLVCRVWLYITGFFREPKDFLFNLSGNTTHHPQSLPCLMAVVFIILTVFWFITLIMGWRSVDLPHHPYVVAASCECLQN